MSPQNIQQRCFTKEIDDTPVHFQFIRLPSQIFVWIGVGTPKFTSLCASMPTRLDAQPSTTVLLPGSSGYDIVPTAQRLVVKTGLPIMLSYNLPPNTDNLRLAAEQYAIQKLEEWKSEQQNTTTPLIINSSS